MSDTHATASSLVDGLAVVRDAGRIEQQPDGIACGIGCNGLEPQQDVEQSGIGLFAGRRTIWRAAQPSGHAASPCVVGTRMVKGRPAGVEFARCRPGRFLCNAGTIERMAADATRVGCSALVRQRAAVRI